MDGPNPFGLLMALKTEPSEEPPKPKADTSMPVLPSLRYFIPYVLTKDRLDVAIV